MVLTLETNYFKLVIFNVYMNSDRRTLESLHEDQSCISCASNFISEQTFVEIIVCGDMNCDPSKGRLFNELRSTAIFNFRHWIDIEQLPSFSYTYVSHKSTASTSWIDHILSSSSNLMPIIQILYGESCQDHIPIY